MANQAAILNWLIAGILGVVLLILVVGVLFWIVGAISAHRNIRKMEKQRGDLRKRVDAEFARGSRLTNHWFSAMKTNCPRRSTDESRSGGDFTLGGNRFGDDSCSGSSSSSSSGSSND